MSSLYDEHDQQERRNDYIDLHRGIQALDIRLARLEVSHDETIRNSTANEGAIRELNGKLQDTVIALNTLSTTMVGKFDGLIGQVNLAWKVIIIGIGLTTSLGSAFIAYSGWLSTQYAPKIERMQTQIRETAPKLERMNEEISNNAPKIERMQTQIRETAPKLERMNEEISNNAPKIERMQTEISDNASDIDDISKKKVIKASK